MHGQRNINESYYFKIGRERSIPPSFWILYTNRSPTQHYVVWATGKRR